MGRPPLTGQRINEKDREHLSAERSRHSRVRSGHHGPTSGSVRGDHQEKRSSVPDAANASHQGSRLGNGDVMALRSS